MKVYKNFLQKKDFLIMQEHLLGDNFPWYFNDGILARRDKYFQFVHAFYHNYNITSDHFWLVKPVIDLLKPRSILRIKANLTPKNEKSNNHGYHTDFDKYENITTGLLYINTNNGFTKFKDRNIEVMSEANKYVEFDCKEKHASNSCTDEKIRVVVNFNYIK